MSYAEFPNTHYFELDYRELLSLYVEVRDKYAGTLNEITALKERLTRYENDVNSRINGAVESAMNAYKAVVAGEINSRFSVIEQNLNGKLYGITQDIAKFKSDVNASNSAYMSETTQRLELHEREVYNELNRHFEYLKDNIEVLLDMVERNSVLNQQKIDALRVWVEDELERIENTIPVELDSIKWIWDKVAIINGFNAIEWYRYTQIDCEYWNESGITCAEWYMDGKHKLFWDIHNQMMFSPLTGYWETVQDIIVELVMAIKVNAITAGEYDEQQFTAQEIDQIRGLVSEYDFNGSVIYNKFDSRTERSC